MLRTVAANHPAKVLGARAAAAYIRLKASVGQGAAARAWLARTQPDRFDTPETRARVSWAEADTLLEVGEMRPALVAFEIARSNLRRAQRPDLLAHLSRRTGDRMVSRGEYEAASAPYREARQIFRHLQDQEGLAGAISGTAAAAIGLGETVAAEALLDQASALYDQHEAVPGGAERAMLYCGKATLYLSRKELKSARQVLEQAGHTTTAGSLNAANIARRGSELACREQRYPDAIALVESALRIYARTGHRAAVACSLRLRGDIAAAQGQLALACRMYRRAVHAHVRAGDLRGLIRVLQHHEALERGSGDASLARYLSDLRLEVEALVE
jgi:tetratricopeptide (TPR) repeat protein